MGGNRVIVSAVEPSRKEIWVNDEILAVNGVSVQEMDRSSFDLSLSQRPTHIMIARRGFVSPELPAKLAEEAARKVYKTSTTELLRVAHKMDSSLNMPAKLLEDMA